MIKSSANASFATNRTKTSGVGIPELLTFKKYARFQCWQGARVPLFVEPGVHVHLAQAELQRDGARGEYHETGAAEERATEP